MFQQTMFFRFYKEVAAVIMENKQPEINGEWRRWIWSGNGCFQKIDLQVRETKERGLTKMITTPSYAARCFAFPAQPQLPQMSLKPLPHRILPKVAKRRIANIMNQPRAQKHVGKFLLPVA